MSLLGDELAGVVDLFGGLTRAELDRALEELAFKRGEEVDEDGFDSAVEDAIDSYHLVAVEHEDEELLVAGPAAFPTLPENAEDLPHIMDVSERSVERQRVATAAYDRLESDADSVMESGDADRAADLVDVSYDLETWGVDAADIRDRLDDV